MPSPKWSRRFDAGSHPRPYSSGSEKPAADVSDVARISEDATSDLNVGRFRCASMAAEGRSCVAKAIETMRILYLA